MADHMLIHIYKLFTQVVRKHMKNQRMHMQRRLKLEMRDNWELRKGFWT